jgi:hypothetical protein
MEQNNKYIWILVALVVVGLGAFYVGKKSATTLTPEEVKATTTNNEVSVPGTETLPLTSQTPPKGTTNLNNSSTAGFNSYASAEYNFTMKYPSYVQVRPGFSTFHEIGNNWRLNAGQANQGKSVVSFSIRNIDQGTYSTGKQTYPLYFTAEVRVGVSPDVKDCYATDAGDAGQQIANVSINGVTWKRFSSSDAGMMKYTQVESYRTVHASKCYAVEQIKDRCH